MTDLLPPLPPGVLVRPLAAVPVDELITHDPHTPIKAAIDEVRRKTPRVVILETVRGVASPRYVDRLYSRLEELRELGYHVEWDIYPVGPSRRKRLYIVAVHESVVDRRHSSVFDWRTRARPIFWPDHGTLRARDEMWRHLITPNVH